MNTEKTVTIATTIGDQDADQFRKKLEEFTSDKDREILQVFISTTPMVVGVEKVQGVQAARTQIVCSAYIEFKCTEQHAREFRLRNTLMKG